MQRLLDPLWLFCAVAAVLVAASIARAVVGMKRDQDWREYRARWFAECEVDRKHYECTALWGQSRLYSP